jgi:hypothetical protein
MDMVDFLGFIIILDGIKMEDNCVKTIAEWPKSMCLRDVLSFLGFANFYRYFIEGYSQIATLLTDLTKGVGLGAKGQRARKQAYKRPFLIIAAAHEAFQMLKDTFCKVLLLWHFNPSLHTCIETNTLGKGLAGIVLQK